MLDVKDFGDYQIATGQISESNKLVISLAGIGSPSGGVPFESVKSFMNLQTKPNLIFLKDNSRSWYTSDHGLDDVVSYIQNFIKTHKISETTTFGLSMGGFGAALLAKKLKADRAIALSPRTLLGPKCKFDTRNKEHSNKLSEIKYDDMLSLLTAHTALTVIYSIDDRYDSAHAVRLLNTTARLVAYRGDHNIARSLKERDQLESFLGDCISGKLTLKKYGFFEPSHHAFALALSKVNVSPAGLTDALLSKTPDEFVPEYLYPELQGRWLIEHLERPSTPYIPVHAAVAYPAHSYLCAEKRKVAPYLGIGWDAPEEFGAWGIGKHHTIKMRMVAMPSNNKIKITLRFRVFKSQAATPIKVAYLCNGEAPTSIHTEGTNQIVQFIARHPTIEITVLTPNPVCPEKLGINSDKRSLSVALLSIRCNLP